MRIKVEVTGGLGHPHYTQWSVLSVPSKDQPYKWAKRQVSIEGIPYQMGCLFCCLKKWSESRWERPIYHWGEGCYRLVGLTNWRWARPWVSVWCLVDHKDQVRRSPTLWSTGQSHMVSLAVGLHKEQCSHNWKACCALGSWQILPTPYLYILYPLLSTPQPSTTTTPHGNKFKPQDRPNIPSCKEYTFHIQMVFTSWGKLDIEIQNSVIITEFNAVIKKIYPRFVSVSWTSLDIKNLL